MEHIHSHHINSCWRKEPILAQNINSLFAAYHTFLNDRVILPLRDQLLFLTKNNRFCISVFFMPYNNKSFTDKVCKNKFGKYPAILSSRLVNNPHNCFFI